MVSPSFASTSYQDWGHPNQNNGDTLTIPADAEYALIFAQVYKSNSTIYVDTLTVDGSSGMILFDGPQSGTQMGYRIVLFEVTGGSTPALVVNYSDSPSQGGSTTVAYLKDVNTTMPIRDANFNRWDAGTGERSVTCGSRTGTDDDFVVVIGGGFANPNVDIPGQTEEFGPGIVTNQRSNALGSVDTTGSSTTTGKMDGSSYGLLCTAAFTGTYTTHAKASPSNDALFTLLDGMPNNSWQKLSDYVGENDLNAVQVTRNKANFNDGGSSVNSPWATDGAVNSAIGSSMNALDAWSGIMVGCGNQQGKLWTGPNGGHTDEGSNEVFEFNLVGAATNINSGGDGGGWTRITDPNPYNATTPEASWPPVALNNYPRVTNHANVDYTPLQSDGMDGPPTHHGYNFKVYDDENNCFWMVPGGSLWTGLGGVSMDGMFRLKFSDGEWDFYDTSVSTFSGHGNGGSCLRAIEGENSLIVYAVNAGSPNCYRYDISGKSAIQVGAYNSGTGGTNNLSAMLVESITGVSGWYDCVYFNNANGIGWFENVFGVGTSKNNFSVDTYSGTRSWGTSDGIAARTKDNSIWICENQGADMQKVVLSGTTGDVTATTSTIATTGNPSGLTNGNGIVGSWQYLEDYDAFVGVLGTQGEVWLFRPENWVKPDFPATGGDLSPGAQLATGV